MKHAVKLEFGDIVGLVKMLKHMENAHFCVPTGWCETKVATSSIYAISTAFKFIFQKIKLRRKIQHLILRVKNGDIIAYFLLTEKVIIDHEFFIVFDHNLVICILCCVCLICYLRYVLGYVDN